MCIRDRFYGPYLLLRSWEIIAQRAADPGRIDLPSDYRPLIEWVYAEVPPPADHPWRAAWVEQAEQALKYQGKAEERLTNPPHPTRPFYGGAQHTFREEEDSSAWMAAQTPLQDCLLYTSDAADERPSVDLGGRRIIKKKTKTHTSGIPANQYRVNNNTNKGNKRDVDITE